MLGFQIFIATFVESIQSSKNDATTNLKFANESKKAKDYFTKKRLKRLKRVKDVIKHKECQKSARIKKMLKNARFTYNLYLFHNP